MGCAPIRIALSAAALAAAGALALALPGMARAAGDIFTVAGNGRLSSLGEGGPATGAGLGLRPALAALPGGGFLVTDGARVRRVWPDGLIRTVAGGGRAGFAGDGGPATAARIRPSDVAALPGGGFLIAECGNNRVRRVGADGKISTVAGSGATGERGGAFAGDGGQATAARLSCPVDVEALAGGGFAVADYDNKRVRRVRLDGVIETIAGNGAAAASSMPFEGRPATQVGVWPDSVAQEAAGSLLVADSFSSRVRRVNPDGTIRTVAGNGREGRAHDDGGLATRARVTPYAVAAIPGGGFLVVDEGEASAAGEEPRVRRVSAGGTITTVAGSGRFVPEPARGDERRGDGGPATAADLLPLRDVESLPDGGFLIGEGIEQDFGSAPGLVRYVAPAAPGLFAAALRRDRDRFFGGRGRPRVSVSLTAAAEVQLVVKAGRRRVATLDASLPAGTTRLALPRSLGERAHTVSLAATGAGGRRALDRFHIYPAGWLNRTLALLVARAIVFTATDLGGYGGDGVLDCRRFAAGRVDCRLSDATVCRRVVAITLRGRRLRWGSYRCGYRAHPRWIRRPRALRPRDFSCEVADTSCPPDLFGRLRERALLPWE